MFGDVVSKRHVNSTILRPGLVSTPMTGYASKHNSCETPETVGGALSDLSHGTKWTHGSPIHSLWGLQMAWTPDWVRHF